MPFFGDSQMRRACDIAIHFDREDRRYRGGETITGAVKVAPQSDVKTNGIVLTHLWRTHGIGTSHVEELQSIQLAEAGSISAGEELSFNFELTAPTDPLTIRGKLFSVDHVVRVHVDIPWALDPSFEEDYQLEVGALPAKLPTSRRDTDLDTLTSSPKTSGRTLSSKVIGWVILTALIPAVAALVSAIPYVGIPILLVILSLIAWFTITQAALKRRLGPVTLTIPHKSVAPGEPWLVELQLQPRRTFPINGIGLTVACVESTVSGSGSDRKTHRHTAFEQVIPLRDACELTAGSEVHERLLMSFPDIPLWSLVANNNKITWSASVRIDIPGFPDWIATTPLQVLPKEFLAQTAIEPELQPHWTTTSEPAPAASVRSAPDTPRARGQQTLSALLAELNALSPHSNARAGLIRRVAGQRFSLSMTIARRSTTLQAGDEDPLYTDGLTLDGTIDGTRQAIRVIALATATPELEQLPEAASWTTAIELIEWDSIYQRINARQISEETR